MNTRERKRKPHPNRRQKKIEKNKIERVREKDENRLIKENKTKSNLYIDSCARVQDGGGSTAQRKTLEGEFLKEGGKCSMCQLFIPLELAASHATHQRRHHPRYLLRENTFGKFLFFYFFYSSLFLSSWFYLDGQKNKVKEKRERKEEKLVNCCVKLRICVYSASVM